MPSSSRKPEPVWRRLASAVSRRLGGEGSERPAPEADAPDAEPDAGPEEGNPQFQPLLSLMAEACAAYPEELRKEGFGDLADRFSEAFLNAGWQPAEPAALDTRAQARALLGADGLAMGTELPAGTTWPDHAESRSAAEARVLAAAADKTKLSGFTLPGAAQATIMHRDTDSWNALLAVEIILEDAPVPDVAALARDPRFTSFTHLDCASGEDSAPMGLYTHALAPRPTSNWPHSGLIVGLLHPEIPDHLTETFAACPAGLVMLQLTEPRDPA